MSLFDLIEGKPVRLPVRLDEDVPVLEAPEEARVAAAFRTGCELHLHAETREPTEVVLALQRTFDAGARHLEVVRPGKWILDVERRRDGPAHSRAHVDVHAADAVDVDAEECPSRAAEDL